MHIDQNLFCAIYNAMGKRKKESVKNQYNHEFCIIKSDTNKNNYKICGKIWIEGENGTFLGIGRLILLKKIQKYGSILKAAKAMNMSYKKAWELVDSINKQAKKPIVITKKGGRQGGGTVLTEEGKKLIKEFEKLQQKFKNFLNNEITKLSSLRD